MTNKTYHEFTDPNAGSYTLNHIRNMEGLERIAIAGYKGAILGAIIGAYFIPEVKQELISIINSHADKIDNTYASTFSTMISLPLNILGGYKIGDYTSKTLAWITKPVGSYKHNVLDLD